MIEPRKDSIKLRQAVRLKSQQWVARGGTGNNGMGRLAGRDDATAGCTNLNEGVARMLRMKQVAGRMKYGRVKLVDSLLWTGRNALSSSGRR